MPSVESLAIANPMQVEPKEVCLEDEDSVQMLIASRATLSHLSR